MSQYYLLDPFAMQHQKPMLERQNNFFGPLIAAIASFIAPTVMAAGGVSAFLLSTAVFIGVTAVATWAISALAPTPRNQDRGRNLLLNQKDTIAPQEIVYGTVRKGGNVTFMGADGSNNKYLHMVLVLAGHEVNAINDVYINDSVVTINSSGIVTSAPWNSKIRVLKYLGTDSQTGHADLKAITNANFDGKGIAYLYIRLEYDQEVFSNGIPTFTAVVRGKRTANANSGTINFSDNASQVILDYLRSPMGVGAKDSEINFSSFVTAQSVSWQSIPLASGGSEIRYGINGVLSTANSPRENLRTMLTACGGTLFWSQGQWHLKVGSYTTPVMNLSDNDIRSDIEILTKTSRSNSFNAVVGTFNNAAQRWINTDYPEFKSDFFIAQDGGDKNTIDLDLPLTTSASAAQRLAKMSLMRSREDFTVTADFGLKAMRLQPGDTVTLTLPRYGWVNKPFEVMSWNLVNSEQKLSVRTVLKETSAEAYDWAAEERELVANNTNLPSWNSGLNVTNVTVTRYGNLSQDGTFVGNAKVSWDIPVNPFIDSYVVQWKRNADTVWNSTTTRTNAIEVGPIEPGVSYQYRVQAVSVGGFSGPWTQVSYTLTGDNTIPAAPTSISATGGYKYIELKWANVADKDLSHVNIYSSLTNTSSSATLVGKSTGTNFVHGDLPIGELRYYWLKSVDFTGNESTAFSSRVQATVTGVAANELAGQILAGQIADGAVSIAKFATGLRPVEIVSTLPTTGNTVGRLVYLTTDNKVYRWTGSTWTANVPAGDISGEIISSQIADNAIIGTKILDGAISEIKVAAGAITSAKLADGAVNTAKFAAGIEPVGISTAGSLPTTKSTEVILWQNKLYRWNGTAYTAAVAAGDLTGVITSTQIDDNAITTPKLATNAVTSDKITANAITAGKVAAGAISTSELAAGAVTSEKVLAKAITASKIFLTDLNSLYPNPDFTGDGWYIRGFTSSEVLPITDANVPYQNYLSLVASTSSSQDIGIDDFFENTPGSSYLLEFYAKTGSPTPSPGTLRLHYRYGTTNPGTGQIAGIWQFLTTVTLTNNWERYSVNIDPPAERKWIRPGIRSDALSGQVHITGMRVVRRANAELIVDGAITANKIATGAITVGKLADGAVSAIKIADGAITVGKIANGAVSTVKIDDNAITLSKIAAGAVDGTKIADGAVDGTKIADGSVSETKITSGAITVSKIADGAVDSVKITDNAITVSKIVNGAVSETKITDSAITTNKIAANAVTTGKISAGAITADQIASNAVVASKLAVSDWENIITDALLEGAASGPGTPGWSVSSGVVVTGAITNGIAPWCFVYPATGTQLYSEWLSPRFVPTKPGTQYHISARFRGSGTAPIQFTPRVWVRWFDKSKTQIGNYVNNGAVVNNTNFNERSWNVTAPANAAYAIFAFGRGGGVVGESNAGYMEMPSVRRMNAGELIVDGAISANKIDVINLSAISADMGSITAGSLNIGGKFIVANDGTTTIRSGTTGERMVLSNNRLDVYDASNVLRVRIGQL